jgi:hypothetical protein
MNSGNDFLFFNQNIIGAKANAGNVGRLNIPAVISREIHIVSVD